MLESYLYEVISESKATSEIYPEIEYKRNHNRMNSPDIIVREGSQVVLIDSKASVPNLALRVFSEEAFKQSINRYADFIVQLYRQIKCFANYNPFKDLIAHDNNDIWGIVAVIEDRFIVRPLIYEVAAGILKIEQGTEVYLYLTTHVKIIEYNILESMVFWSKSISKCLKSVANHDTAMDFYTFGDIPKGEENQKFAGFRNRLADRAGVIMSTIL